MAAPPKPSLPFDEHDREVLLDLSVQQRDRLINAIRAVTGVRQPDAEDLLQDVWVQFLERGVAEDPQSWFAYLRTAAKNRHIDKVRRTERAEQAAARVPVPAWLARHRDPVTESLAFRTLFLDALTDLQTLSAKERQAFLLRYYDDLRPAAIAERMALRTTQVDELLRQAKERLAKTRRSREGSRAYALLALILRPATDRADALSTPVASVVTVAATVLSLVAVVSGSGPAPAHASAQPRDLTAAAVPTGRMSASTWPGPHVPAHGDVVGAPPQAADPASTTPAARTLPPITVPSPCTEHVCVGGPSRPGDTITVRIFEDEYVVTESVTPVCEHVPSSPAVQCSRQEPEQWVVNEGPPPPPNGGML